MPFYKGFIIEVDMVEGVPAEIVVGAEELTSNYVFKHDGMSVHILIISEREIIVVKQSIKGFDLGLLTTRRGVSVNEFEIDQELIPTYSLVIPKDANDCFIVMSFKTEEKVPTPVILWAESKYDLPTYKKRSEEHEEKLASKEEEKDS